MNYDIRVSNLPDNTPKCDLSGLFAQYGFNNIDIKDQRDFDGEKEETVEYVRLEDGDSIQDAIDRLNGRTWRKRTLTVEKDFRYTDDGHAQPSQPPRSGTSAKKRPPNNKSPRKKHETT